MTARAAWIGRMWVGLAGFACIAGCGDDAAKLDGCGSDADCKGERICVDSMCVDPNTAGGAGGVGGAGGNGGGPGGQDGGESMPDPTQPIDDPALEAACMRDCTARQVAACPMNVNLSLDQCNAQCLIIDEQNRGYCLPELRARYDCLADGGYTCVNDYAQPKSTCIEETQEFSQCAQTIPCHDFCAQTDGGCSADEDSCYDDCMADLGSLETTLLCSSYYSGVLSCWTQQGSSFTCEDGVPSLGDCGRSIADTAACIDRRGETCDGWCWAAEQLGCGDGCAADCAAKLADTSCGFYYERVISCAIDRSDLHLACSGGAPTADATECMSDLMQYESCVGSL